MNHFKKLISALNLIIITDAISLLSCEETEEVKEQTNRRMYRDMPVNATFNPKKYLTPKIESAITIDGNIDEDVWDKAEWSDLFQDIEGPPLPKPYYDTKMKMLWDDDNLYIAAWMEEEHLWATLKQRDTIIFLDNDFEVFIEKDGDTHNYYEIEVNAYNTIFDLMMVRPYRDNGPLVIPWDAANMQSNVKMFGTLNDPSDLDSAWTVEMAIPWEYINEEASRNKTPETGEIWRINFSRVQYEIEIDDNKYKKKVNSRRGRARPDNWVWSPQGVINMHCPEMWGYLLLTGTDGKEIPFPEEDEEIKWGLRRLYYNQQIYRYRNKTYAQDFSEIGMDTIQQIKDREPKIILTHKGFEISEKSGWGIKEDGEVFRIRR